MANAPKDQADVRMVTIVDPNRQAAAKCVATLFQGRGKEIIKQRAGGVGYLEEGKSSFDDEEKAILQEMFDFFLGLIEGKDKKFQMGKQQTENYEETEED